MEEVEIPQRQQGLVPDEDLAGRVHEIIAGAAGLDAGAAVGAAAVDVFGQIAVSAVADAEGAVDEAFDLAADGPPDGADFRQRQLPLGNDAGEAEAFEKGGPLRCPDGALCRGVQRQRKVLAQLQQGEILDNQGVDARRGQLMYQLPGLLQLTVIEDGIDRDEDARAVAVGIGAQRPDILHAVPGGLPGPERRACDIHRIGTAVDGCDADGKVSCRRKQFERVLHAGGNYLVSFSIFLRALALSFSLSPAATTL